MSAAHPRLAEQLAELPNRSRDKLLEQFEELYGRPAPLRLSHSILTLAIAYRLQEQVYGGLKPAVRRQLLTYKEGRLSRPSSPGTVLVREWHGRTHTVVVHQDRVEYGGERFRSLTEVALRITGQKRSGPAFFGLRSRGRG